jgi:sortase A
MISKILLFIGLGCLGLYGFFALEAHLQQAALERELYRPLPTNSSAAAPKASKPRPRRLSEGDLFGRLEIPRLNLSVMVMEGDADSILRLGAGHVPGTPLAIAGHRDTFFRPLKDIKLDDTIRVTTPEGVSEYRVVSTQIVGPTDVSVLDAKDDSTLTLITCYPFYYIGPAPKRFIIQAHKDQLQKLSN